MDLLIKKARGHDKAAFQQLMQEHGKDMYNVARAILKDDEDVADAMQETALACWEKIGTLKKDNYFRTWLTRILINNCTNIYRQRRHFAAEDTLPEPGSQEEGYSNVEWENVLDGLEEKYRTVIILYYVQGFKTREVARILQVNESTIRGRLSRARRELERQYLRDGKGSRRKGGSPVGTGCAATCGTKAVLSGIGTAKCAKHTFVPNDTDNLPSNEDEGALPIFRRV